MNGSRSILILTLFSVFVSGCRQTMVSGIEAARPEEERVVWDDSVYCFNGRSIVWKDGLCGMVGENGRILCAPVYDEIEFLNFDVALLSRYGTWYLATKDGRIMAENSDRKMLEAGHEAIFEAVSRSDRVYWDDILEKYEAFCSACIDARMSAGSIGTVISLRDGLNAELDNARGHMTPEQIRRFQDIRERYNCLFQ